MKYIYFLILILTVPTFTEIQAETQPFWVFFKDRGSIDIAKTIAAKRTSPAEPKHTGRRANLLRNEQLFDEKDVPVFHGYIEAVADYTERIRTVSRYFNAVTVDLDDTAVDAVVQLPFVGSVERVRSFRKPIDRFPIIPEPRLKVEALDYGNSFQQLSMIGVTKLHNLGYRGEGIRIAVLDSGFDDLNHTAFDSLNVAYMWDFVDGNSDAGGDSHGSTVLSIMAALDHGSMIGASPYAEYVLLRTENRETELRIEEDYWIAGVELADSLNCDIINSSLGYTDFPDDNFSYTYEDMDGRTARTTLAANIAVEKGMVVVTSAGNHGDEPWYYISSPADGLNVIAVGAVDRNGDITSFSSRGPTADGRVKPDFVALGQQVWMMKPSTANAYQYANGTSYSAPSASGAVALLLEIHPSWSPVTVIDSLRAAAGEAGPDSLYGYGLIDVFAASGLEEPGTVVSEFTVYDPYPQPFVLNDVDRRLFFPMDVPVDGKALTIRIFNFSGERVWAEEKTIDNSGNLVDRTEAPNWDGKNFEGEDVASGIYYYTIRLNGYGRHIGKIAVIR